MLKHYKENLQCFLFSQSLFVLTNYFRSSKDFLKNLKQLISLKVFMLRLLSVRLTLDISWAATTWTNGWKYTFNYLSNQEDFTWQDIWRTSIHLFKVHPSDHLLNYFLLLYRYGISTKISHLTFSRAEFNHYRNI